MAKIGQMITITAELIEEEEGGYSVYCPELDIYTQGDDRDEALENLKEAAQLHIEEIGISHLKLKRVDFHALKLQLHG